MEGTYLFDLSGAILAAGIVFWLAGGPSWLAEKVRQLELANDLKEVEIDRMKIENERLRSERGSKSN